MEAKDIVALVLSTAAFCLSIYATVRGERKSNDERQRTVRGQLTDVLGKLTALALEGAKIQHEAKDERNFLQAVSQILGQQNGFLLDQAVYLSEQIPNLVTTYEFNTIAGANATAGNLLLAEKYFTKAVEVAPNALYTALAVRSYAVFLYPQGRLNEGREQFRRAVDLLKGEDNFIRWTKGLTYQAWALSELNFARSPEKASEYFENARKEFASIDADAVRNTALASLEAARHFPTSQQLGPNASLPTTASLAVRL